MRKLQLLFKSLFSSIHVGNEGILKEEDSPSPASTPKEVRTELETDMEEFMTIKSTNFVGFTDVQEHEFRNKFKVKYAREGLDFLLKRLNDSPEAESPKEAFSIINKAIDDLNNTFPLDWSINPSISSSDENKIVITLLSHKLIVDKDGAFRIIDLKNGDKVILSKQSKD